MAPGSLDAYRASVWNLTEFVDAANALLPDYLPKDASGRLADEVNPRLVRHYATLGLLPEPGKEGREARYLFEHLVHLLVVRKLLAEGFGSAAIRDAVAGRKADELVALLEGSVRVALLPQGVAQQRAPFQAAQTASSTAARSRAALLRAVRAKAGLNPEDSAPTYAAHALTMPPDDAQADQVHDVIAPSHAAQSSPMPSRRMPSSPVTTSPMPSSNVPFDVPSSDAVSDAASDAASGAAGALLDADDHFHSALASIFRPSDWTRIRIDEGLELHVRDDYRLPRNRAGDDDLLRLLKAALLDLEQRSKGRP